MELESPPPLEIGSDSSDAMAQQCLNVTARGRALARGPAAQEQLAACKDTSKANSERACSRLGSVPFANSSKRSMGHVLGAEKGNFLFAAEGALRSVAAAPVESCQSLPNRCPWGRLGSVLYTCNRLRRIRRRFKHFWPISLSRPLGLAIFWPWFASRALREH